MRPKYYVGVESRAYVILPEGDQFLGRPDISIASPVPLNAPTSTTTHDVIIDDVDVIEVEVPIGEKINHYYLEIRSAETHELITVIELLSLANKVDENGRHRYERTRYDIIMSSTNLVEIDLLRAGEPLPLDTEVKCDYRILIRRSWTRRKAHLYAFNLHLPIPSFPLPVQSGEDEPLVNLNKVVHDLYSRARFDLRIDYTQPPVPPLTEKQTERASQLLGQ